MNRRKLVVTFAFIGEGSSDNGLRQHLELLCIEGGADEVRGVVPDLQRIGGGTSIQERLLSTRDLEPATNLYFIHRDADSEDTQPRYDEITNAIAESIPDQVYVAVVPIQEAEAWLLLDESAIRQVAGRPGGRTALDLPTTQRIEKTAQPKERLQAALILAADLRGRRLDRFKASFNQQRQLLLERLPLGGPLSLLTAWCRLRDDTAAAIAALRDDQEGQR